MFNKLTTTVNWDGMRKATERQIFCKGYTDIFMVMTGPN